MNKHLFSAYRNLNAPENTRKDELKELDKDLTRIQRLLIVSFLLAIALGMALCTQIDLAMGIAR